MNNSTIHVHLHQLSVSEVCLASWHKVNWMFSYRPNSVQSSVGSLPVKPNPPGVRGLSKSLNVQLPLTGF